MAEKEGGGRDGGDGGRRRATSTFGAFFDSAIWQGRRRRLAPSVGRVVCGGGADPRRQTASDLRQTIAAQVVGSHEVESLVTARSMVRGEVPKSEAVAGPAYGQGSMALLLVGAQRLQLFRLAVGGERQGVLGAEMVGKLHKQGEEGKVKLSKWKERHFELKGGSLYYYHEKDDAKPKGVIPLTDRRTEVLADNHKLNEPHSFVICEPKRTWYLQAASAAAKEKGVETLRSRVGAEAAELYDLKEVTPRWPTTSIPAAAGARLVGWAARHSV